jgi:Fur family iron response transcriptional regulator
VAPSGSDWAGIFPRRVFLAMALQPEALPHILVLSMTIPATSQIIAERLRAAGLRPTRQRVALACLLFAGGDRHVTAELLHEEAQNRKVPVSLATVYNTLHQFTEVGLLREVAVEGAKAYFDTNTSNHYHFFCEHSGKLLDIETTAIRIEGLPEAPDGMVISRVDVLVRLVTNR